MGGTQNPGALVGAAGAEKPCHANAAGFQIIAQPGAAIHPGVATATVREALDFAARGWHVFPAEIVNGAKKGCVSGKQNGGARWGATVDPDTIRRYWARFPDALLGVTTGPESGLFVVDIDTAAAHGADGIADLERWIAEYGPLPDTIEAKTPTGGRHIYFKWPESATVANSSKRLAAGIDVRGTGGMVMAPPSRKPGGGAYSWLNPPGWWCQQSVLVRSLFLCASEVC